MRHEIGIAVLSLLVVGGVGHVGLGTERAFTRPSKQVGQDHAVADPNPGPLVEDLETLPDGVTMQLTEQKYPEVYDFFRERIAAKEQAAVSTSRAAGCCGAGSSVRAVQTTGGVLSILDRGDGVVHVLAFVIDDENPDLGNMDGLALSAIITEDGVEILSMDMDRLARFIGGKRGGAVDADSAVASIEEEADGGGSETLDVAIDCNWTSARVCCAVATDSRFCVCCASLNPINVGCGCMPLM